MRNLSLMGNLLIRPWVLPVVLRVGAEGQNGARSVLQLKDIWLYTKKFKEGQRYIVYAFEKRSLYLWEQTFLIRQTN